MQNQCLKIYIFFCSIIQMYLIVTLNKLQMELVIFLDWQETNRFTAIVSRKKFFNSDSFCHPESFTSFTKLAAHLLAFILD